jgi:hypothetical protein
MRFSPGNGRFTRLSPGDHKAASVQADTDRETMPSTASQRRIVLAFMGAVTCGLLALVFSGAARGGASALELVVYGGCAALGLEFLWSAWPSLWGDGPPNARDSADAR